VIDGVCTANVDMLVNVGFKRGITEKLCRLFIERGKAVGIFNLVAYHNRIKERGGSNLISAIVKEQNRIYFASRSNLEGTVLLKALEAPAVDIPSRMLKWILAGKHKSMRNVLEEIQIGERIEQIKDYFMRGACTELCEAVDQIFLKQEDQREPSPWARGGFCAVCGNRK